MPSPIAIVLTALVFLNAGFPLWRVITLTRENIGAYSSKDTLNEYSYIGPDYPFYHPTLSLKPASLTLQETVRYGYNSSDVSTQKEWDQILDSPEGTGRIHLGPDHRTFVLSFYHQLHCIVELKEALVNRSDTWANPHHINHCLQYLRQTLLCQGNDMLEEGDFLEHHFETDRLGPEVQCYDWEGVYQEVGARYLLFDNWKKKVDSL